MNGVARSHEQMLQENASRFDASEESSNGLEMISVSNGLLGGQTSDNGESSPKQDGLPSNENLLSIAFLSFMGFTTCQTVAAFIARSEAMMGDSAAMFVDALTYLFNWIAERRKTQFDQVHAENFGKSQEERLRLRKRAKRKMTLQLELIPPLISVSTLVLVTAVVSHKAIKVLILDMHRDRSKQTNPNLKLMLCFSVGNLVLDLFNVFCFAKAKHAMGYSTSNEPIVHSCSDKSPRSRVGNRTYVHLDGDDDSLLDEEEPGLCSCKELEKTVQTTGEATSHAVTSTSVAEEEEDGEEPNLNMCSAYTHVFADTLRSIAVVVASIVAELVEEITPEEADAAAAVVVSFLILLSLIPLIHGLVQTFSELKAIGAEEVSEAMFPGAEATLYRMAMDDTGNNNNETVSGDPAAV